MDNREGQEKSTPQWIRESKPQSTTVVATGIASDLVGAYAPEWLIARLESWREAIVGTALRSVAGGEPPKELRAIEAILARRPAFADCNTLVEKVEKAVESAAMVDMLLRKHGAHGADCMGTPCTCGWAAVLEWLRGNAKLVAGGEPEQERRTEKQIRDACFHDMRQLVMRLTQDSLTSHVTGRQAMEALLEGIDLRGPEGFGDVPAPPQGKEQK